MAMDAPPDRVTVGGASYSVNTDYRVWIRISELARELYGEIKSDADAWHNLRIICDMERLAFGGVLADERPDAVLAAIREFLKGYPEPPENGPAEEKERVLSLGLDINYIILAVRNQGGPDLSYKRKEPFHWWEFLIEVRSLCGDHQILNLMRIRGYEDESRKEPGWAGREAMRLKRRYALPYEMTADEKRAADEFDRLTGG